MYTYIAVKMVNIGFFLFVIDYVITISGNFLNQESVRLWQLAYRVYLAILNCDNLSNSIIIIREFVRQSSNFSFFDIILFRV